MFMYWSLHLLCQTFSPRTWPSMFPSRCSAKGRHIKTENINDISGNIYIPVWVTESEGSGDTFTWHNFLDSYFKLTYMKLTIFFLQKFHLSLKSILKLHWFQNFTEINTAIILPLVNIGCRVTMNESMKQTHLSPLTQNNSSGVHGRATSRTPSRAASARVWQSCWWYMWFQIGETTISTPEEGSVWTTILQSWRLTTLGIF